MWKMVLIRIRNARKTTTQQPQYWALGVYPEKRHNSKKHMYPDVHWSTSYNRQDMEATYMSIDRWRDKAGMLHIYNGILFSHKKEQIGVSSTEVDEHITCYTEWSQKEKNKYSLLTDIYMESRKIALMTLFAGKEWKHKCKEWTCGHSVGESEWDEWRK